ncbi:MAG: ribonuclease H-like domain-containing protein [Polyangiaceae bacterium]|nr:ribonuclease H-like domain-containing protein [Polyangiaceae bacterium]
MGRSIPPPTVSPQFDSARPEGPEARRPTNASSWIEHAFVEEETPHGVIYCCRKPTPLGHRVGSIGIATSLAADPSVLAMLALDPSLAGCDLRRALYLDTETTGLAGGTGTVPFLLGLGYYDAADERFVVEQVLLRTFAEEAAMVEHLRRRAAEASMLVTFNGKAFDWSLLKTRSTMNRADRLPVLPHLDLLHVVRRLHKHRLRSCALQRIEEDILGQRRVDDVCGADIAAIYHHYVRTRDVAALEPVIIHNSLDVVSMFALVGLYGEQLTADTNGDAWASTLAPSDLAAAAVVARRAKDLDRALHFAEASVERGAGAFGHRARAEIAKARGDKAAALADFERALAQLDGSGAAADPSTLYLRLELAKLYEHHARAFDKAKSTLVGGTTESADRHGLRLRRLQAKIEASAKRAAAGEIVRNKPKKRRLPVSGKSTTTAACGEDVSNRSAPRRSNQGKSKQAG